MAEQITKIDVAVLFVSDVERSKVFYQETLGLTMKFADDTNAGFDLGPVLLIVLNRDGARDLLTQDAVARSPAGAVSQLVSFVDNVDEVYSDLVSKGVKFIREPVNREWGLRTAHFKDPDGNVWEIAQTIAKELPSE